MSFRLLGFLIVAFAASSCVSNKKIVYLQKDDVNEPGVPVDTVVRRYEIDLFNYKLQTNDIIDIDFKSLTPKEFDLLAKEETQNLNNVSQSGALLIGYLIDNEGKVPIPVLGEVKVAGLTIFEAQDTLQKLANLYLESPTVKVRLLNFRFTILGECVRQGTVVLANNQVTLLEAVGQAGGLTDMADRSRVKIIRQHADKVVVQYVNLLDENFINSPYYYVNQNDVIIVPALKQRPYQTYFGKNLALIISSVSLLILVVGIIQK